MGDRGDRVAGPGTPWRARRTWWIGLALAALAATRLVPVFTTAVNWDEFALLANADRSLETGVLHSGGRPGLGVLLLLPFVSDCDDELGIARRARLLWLAITLCFLAGLAVLVGRLQPRPEQRLADAGLAVALLAGVPAFLEWSVQVRTDQVALAAGVWGGVALLASRRHIAFSFAAGLLLAVGFAATQKLVYLGALVGLLAAADVALARDWDARRELTRIAACVGTMGAVLLGYDAALGALFPPRAGHMGAAALGPALDNGLSVFDFYRRTIGYSQYRAMLPTLAPHALLALALAWASLSAWRGRRAGSERLALAWLVLALGAAVALFHKAAFAYFWMTLGIFPAVAFGLAREPLLALTGGLPRAARAGALAALACLVAVPALWQSAAMFEDTQSVQARSLHFVRRNFTRGDAGFQPESAIFCQSDPRPFPTFFSQSIYRRFAGPGREQNAAQLREQFRERPVKFIVDSWRLRQFPESLRRFWLEHYLAYRDAVHVAGRHVAGARGEPRDLELIVPGDYRWLPAAADRRISIDGVLLSPGQVVRLESGWHRAVLEDDVEHGMLVLALAEPPGPASLPFYKVY